MYLGSEEGTSCPKKLFNIFILLCIITPDDKLLSFDRIFLLLADKVDMDKILDEFENWPHRPSVRQTISSKSTGCNLTKLTI